MLYCPEELFIGHFLLKEDVLKEYFRNMCKEYVGSFEKRTGIIQLVKLLKSSSVLGKRIDFLILLQKNHLFIIFLKNLIRFFLRCIIM